MIVSDIITLGSVLIIRAYRHNISLYTCGFLASLILDVLANYVLLYKTHNRSIICFFAYRADRQ